MLPTCDKKLKPSSDRLPLLEARENFFLGSCMIIYSAAFIEGINDHYESLRWYYAFQSLGEEQLNLLRSRTVKRFASIGVVELVDQILQ